MALCINTFSIVFSNISSTKDMLNMFLTCKTWNDWRQGLNFVDVLIKLIENKKTHSFIELFNIVNIDQYYVNELLEAAIEYNNLDIVDALLKDSRVDPSGSRYVLIAAELGYLSIVERLLDDPRVNPIDRFMCVLKWVVHHAGNIELAQRIARYPGAKPVAIAGCSGDKVTSV